MAFIGLERTRVHAQWKGWPVYDSQLRVGGKPRQNTARAATSLQMRDVKVDIAEVSGTVTSVTVMDFVTWVEVDTGRGAAVAIWVGRVLARRRPGCGRSRAA